MYIALIELTDLVKKGLPRAKDHLAILVNNNQPAIDLYEMLSNETYKNEEELMQAAGFDRAAYRRLCKLLIDSLSKLVVLIHGEKIYPDDWKQQTLENNRRSAALRILSSCSAKNAAALLAEETLEIARRNEVPRHSLESLAILTEYYSIIKGDVDKFRLYSDQLRHVLKSIALWEEVFIKQCEFYSINLKRKNDDNCHVIDLEEMLGKEQDVFQSQSFDCQLSYYTLIVSYLIKSNRFDTSLQYADKALELFQHKPYLSHNVISTFSYLKLLSFTMLREFDKGEQAAEQALNYATEGTIDWFNTLEVYFYLCMHSKRWDRALDIYKLAVEHKRFLTLRPISQEMWTLLGAYLYVVYALSKPGTELKNLPRFRASKFINDLPQFTQDKSGMNAAALIAHTLLLFTEDRRWELYERIQALDKYSNRYLRESSTVRSRLFIRMLTLLPKTHFRRSDFAEKAGKVLEELQRYPVQVSQQAHELEIIPYEYLYEIIVNSLSDRTMYMASRLRIHKE